MLETKGNAIVASIAVHMRYVATYVSINICTHPSAMTFAPWTPGSENDSTSGIANHKAPHITNTFSVSIHLVPSATNTSAGFHQFYDLIRPQPPDAFAPILANLKHWQLPANP